MGEGWETARRRDDGNDWVLVRLAAPGVGCGWPSWTPATSRATRPAAATLRGVDARDRRDLDDPAAWFEILPPRRGCSPDTRHRFPVGNGMALSPRSLARSARLTGSVVTHVRLDVFPDGGLARLRLWGRLAAGDLAEMTLRWFNLLPAAQARAVLTGAGGLADAAAEALVAARPVTDIAAIPAPVRPARH